MLKLWLQLQNGIHAGLKFAFNIRQMASLDQSVLEVQHSLRIGSWLNRMTKSTPHDEYRYHEMSKASAYVYCWEHRMTRQIHNVNEETIGNSMAREGENMHRTVGLWNMYRCIVVENGECDDIETRTGSQYDAKAHYKGYSCNTY